MMSLCFTLHNEKGNGKCVTLRIMWHRKNLSEMAWTSVADFERDFDEAAGGFPDQLLSLQHALSDPELQRRHRRQASAMRRSCISQRTALGAKPLDSAQTSMRSK